MFLALISRIRRSNPSCSSTRGTSSPLRMTSRTWVSSLRPKAPPGWDSAKSSALKPRASSRAAARASPRANCTVVLAVGARFKGQASRSTLVSSTQSACLARLEVRPPVMPAIRTPWRLRAGSSDVSSWLSPLLEIASTMSLSVTMPRSPWLASAGCTKKAGVPVDARVAAILRPMWPLLPMPMTTTRPGVASMACATCTKRSSSRWASACSDWISMVKVSRAVARACDAPSTGEVGMGMFMDGFYRGGRDPAAPSDLRLAQAGPGWRLRRRNHPRAPT